MTTRIEQYKTPIEYHPTPTHKLVLEDPPLDGQTSKTLFDLKVTVFHSMKGIEVIASQSGRKLEGRIEADNDERIIFPQSHSVIIVQKGK